MAGLGGEWEANVAGPSGPVMGGRQGRIGPSPQGRKLQAHLKVSFSVTLSTSEPKHKAPSPEHGYQPGPLHSP